MVLYERCEVRPVGFVCFDCERSDCKDCGKTLTGMIINISSDREKVTVLTDNDTIIKVPRHRVIA